MPTADPKKVFVVVGRNTAASDAMFSFLRALGLTPIEWGTAVRQTGSGSPYIGQVLDVGFAMAQAVVVLMTPDDVAHLRPEYARDEDDPEIQPMGQARPNVLFEAGMAFGRHPDRTILVELGSLRQFTDVGGRHTVRLTNDFAARNELANRLETADCDVDRSGSDWTRVGDFTPPKAPSGPTPTGRRLPSSGAPAKRAARLDGRFFRRSSGPNQLQLTNRTEEDLLDLKPLNAKDLHGRIIGFPVAKIPAGKTVTLNVALSTASPRQYDLIVAGRTEIGDEFTEALFLDLNA
ncbi:MAG: putative nucleotide-binding protein containing TIR-like domain [Mycobacterium sp.]|nr:putative nucleotide-binding protein containing TIR-like domain [Mycobacterium sp.]